MWPNTMLCFFSFVTSLFTNTDPFILKTESNLMQTSKYSVRIVSLFTLFILSLPFSGYAEVNKEQLKQAKLQEKKQKILTKVNARIANLQKFQSCVSAANDHKDMKKCHEMRKSFNKANKS